MNANRIALAAAQAVAEQALADYKAASKRARNGRLSKAKREAAAAEAARLLVRFEAADAAADRALAVAFPAV